MDRGKNSDITVVIIDDDPQMLMSSSLMLQSGGIKNIVTIQDSRTAEEQIEKLGSLVVVLDLYMPHVSGVDLLDIITAKYPWISVMIMTAANEIASAVDCMKKGAFDYIVKPVEKERFLLSVRRAMDIAELKAEIASIKERFLEDKIENKAAFSGIVTRSKKMRAIFQYAEAIAATNKPVLISGETGTGKELIAEAIHKLSGRKGDFVVVNAAGLDDTMFSDALFGHIKGAYTGAFINRDGLIAKAAGGTLFLDEIGDLSEQSQVKLLRLIQNNSFYPLGSDFQKQSSARILAATNRDMESLLASGRFRHDLYYRLKSHQINLPSLRQRIEDIPMLTEYFAEKAAAAIKKKKPVAPANLSILLKNYSFPGNIRELEALVFDAVLRSSSGYLCMDSFNGLLNDNVSILFPDINKTQKITISENEFPTLKEAEEFLIHEALSRAEGNQGIAASLLGISRQALNKRILRDRRGDDTV